METGDPLTTVYLLSMIWYFPLIGVEVVIISNYIANREADDSEYV